MQRSKHDYYYFMLHEVSKHDYYYFMLHEVYGFNLILSDEYEVRTTVHCNLKFQDLDSIKNTLIRNLLRAAGFNKLQIHRNHQIPSPHLVQHTGFKIECCNVQTTARKSVINKRETTRRDNYGVDVQSDSWHASIWLDHFKIIIYCLSDQKNASHEFVVNNHLLRFFCRLKTMKAQYNVRFSVIHITPLHVKTTLYKNAFLQNTK